MSEALITDHFINIIIQHQKFQEGFHRMFSQHLDAITNNSNKSNETSYSQIIKENENSSEELNQCLLADNSLGSQEMCINTLASQIHSPQSAIQKEDENNCFKSIYSQIANLIAFNQKIGLCKQIQVLLKQQRFQQTKIKSEIQQIKASLSSMKMNQYYNTSQNQGSFQYSQFITKDQFKNREFQLLQKIDVCIHRNSCKIQSIFSDKLNSVEMKFDTRIESLESNAAQKPNKQVQTNQLVKKLKNSKSIGNLFGFK